MSKGTVALIAVLAFLAGAGCSAAIISYIEQQKIEAVFMGLAELSKDAAESVTETTESVTEITETTETVTEAAAETTEAVTETTEAVTEAASTESALPLKDRYYELIRNELIPAYGLSDMDGFDKYGSQNETYLEQPIPKSTQGIISAQISDFNADGIEECILLRAEEGAYILELYNSDCIRKDSFEIWNFPPGECMITNTFTVSVIDHRIVISQQWYGLPGFSRYGTETVILSAAPDGFSNQLQFGGSRYPGYCDLHVNSESVIGDEDMDGEDFAEIRTMLETTLAAIDIEYDSMRFGWDVLEDLSYGIEVDFSEDAQLLFDFGYSDDLFHFVDHTALRDALS